MKMNIFGLFSILISLSCFARAGSQSSGGGGLFLESDFLRVAKKSIQDLTSNQIRYSHGRSIPLEKLALVVFTIGLDIKVTDIPLKLNDSLKSAITRKDKVTLYKPDWDKIQDAKQFRKMVLHELMRTVSVDDDDYSVSDGLELALTAKELFSKKKTLTAKLFTPRLGQFITCEEGVEVTCGTIINDVPTEYTAVSILNPKKKKYYYGACFDLLIYCP